MGLIASAKGTLIQTFLKKLTDGDTGSTLLGALAAAALAVGNFGDLFSHDPNAQAREIGLLAAAVVVALWGYFTGRKTKDTTK